MEASSQGPFATAIQELLEDLKLKPKETEKNPFLVELVALNQQSAATSSGTGTLGSDESANKLREFVKELESRRTAGHTYKILDRLSGFIDNLQGLMRICESLLQDAPFGVSIAFSGARVVLDLAFKVHSQFETVIEAIEEIGTRLEYYQLLAKYDRRPGFQKLLVSSYKHIIQFWLKASQILSQNFLKTMMRNITKPLHTVIKDAHNNIKEDGNLVQQYATAIGLTNTKEDRDEQKKERIQDAQTESWNNERRIRHDIAVWIRGDENLDANTDFEHQLDRRKEGTCNWIFENPKFVNWRDAKHGGLLWYNAPPGSGKSVLASSVIEHLRKRDEKVALFFYSFSSVTRRNGINGIRSIALQLLTMTPRLSDKLVQLYEEQKHFAPFLQSYKAAKDIIQELLSPLDHIYLVIDGLDECPDEMVTLSLLCSLVRAKVYGTVKWMFLSRDYAQIREEIEKLEVTELCPAPEVISADIQTYVTSTLTCSECFDEWSDKDEQNFLYARFVCETLQRVGLTRRADIEPALQRFPKTLNSYYARSLEDFESYSTEQQELVRRVFVILTGAEQAVSFNELLDALSIDTRAKDHDDSRVPQPHLIERLCGPLITLERPNKDSQDNPIVKFYHKTVKDFLLQSPDTITEMSDGARKYFITTKDAHEELGRLCLTYLKYDRYIKCQNPKTLLETADEKHAFLRYAATFWFQHMWGVDPTPEITAQVTEFLTSGAFWTCLCVQSYIARYLFGSFTDMGLGFYTMDYKDIKKNGSNFFGLPLPQWLGGQSPECMLMDQSLCSFAIEWREVITNHPEGLDLCVPLRPFAHSCQLEPLVKSKRLRVKHIPGLSNMDAVAEARFLDVSFLGKKLAVSAILRKEDDTHGNVHILQATPFSNKGSSSSQQHLPLGGRISEWEIFSTGGEEMEAWGVDPRTLNVRRTTSESSERFEMPHSARKYLTGKKDGEWELLRSTTISRKSHPQQTSTRVLQIGWRPRRVPIQSSRLEDRVQEEESDDDSVWSESDSEDDNTSDKKSTSGSSDNQSATEASDTDHDGEDDEEMIDSCLILLQPRRPPCWTRPWATPIRRWEKVGCAVHPSIPLLAFTHTSLQLELLNIESMVQESKHLPEPVDVRGKPTASTREVQFSACGNYLHCLTISFVDEKIGTSCSVTVSTYRFNTDSKQDETFIRDRQPSQFTYRFAERLADIALPLTLTFWSDDALLIALPPLTCDPKIILVDLPRAGIDESAAIRTLCTPIYFPTSTPSREPRLLQRPGSDDTESYLYLALSASHPPSSDDNPTDSPPEGDNDIRKASTQASPPVVLQWRIPQQNGWRAWDAESDEKSSDLRRDTPVWKLLRGNFVESEKPFSVPIRCGLNWNRKGYLSCA